MWDVVTLVVILIVCWGIVQAMKKALENIDD